MAKHAGRITLLLLVLASLVVAGDVSGKWKGPLDGGEGEVQFTFKLDGTALSGSMSGGDSKPFPLTGKLDGEKISFTVEFEYQGTPMKLVINGTVAEAEMKLNIATADSSWSSTMTAKKQTD